MLSLLKFELCSDLGLQKVQTSSFWHTLFFLPSTAGMYQFTHSTLLLFQQSEILWCTPLSVWACSSLVTVTRISFFPSFFQMHRINYHCKVQFGTEWLLVLVGCIRSSRFFVPLVTCAHQECPHECLSYLFFVFLYSLGIKGHYQINCVDNDSDFPQEQRITATSLLTLMNMFIRCLFPTFRKKTPH